MLIVLGAGFSIISLRYFPVPYIWISLFFFLISVYAAVTRIKPFVKLLCLNLGMCILILGGLEGYLWRSQISGNKERFEGDYVGGYTVNPEDILGYVPQKGKVVRSRKYFGEQLLYEVIYTIDVNGLRVSPASGNGDNNDCILFFGGSCTFGEGVNDNETMPYIVGVKKKEKYKVYNFAFHGYGPHQMLSAIENNIVDDVINCKPKYAIYQALVSHVDRSAGLSSWDTHGPRYVFSAEGEVTYDGHFDDSLPIKRKVLDQLGKSFIYKKYIDRKESISRANTELFIGIVDKASRSLKERHPGLKFHVILWDIPKKNYELIMSKLKAKKIPVHPIGEILPDYPASKSTYQVSPPYDAHPNFHANEYIADYIITHIIDK